MGLYLGTKYFSFCENQKLLMCTVGDIKCFLRAHINGMAEYPTPQPVRGTPHRFAAAVSERAVTGVEGHPDRVCSARRGAVAAGAGAREGGRGGRRVIAGIMPGFITRRV